MPVAPQQYNTVPQSPLSARLDQSNSQIRSYSNQLSAMATLHPMAAQDNHRSPLTDRQEAARRVATGQLGGGYGPYSVRILANHYVVALVTGTTHVDLMHYSTPPTSIIAETLFPALPVPPIVLLQKRPSSPDAGRGAHWLHLQTQYSRTSLTIQILSRTMLYTTPTPSAMLRSITRLRCSLLEGG